MPASPVTPIASNALPLALAVLGLAVGTVIASVAASYRRDRSFWSCLLGARSRIRAMLPAPVIATVSFYGLALQYRDNPLLLAVGVVESTLLVAVLIIDVDLRLIPTPLVGTLALLALASASA